MQQFIRALERMKGASIRNLVHEPQSDYDLETIDSDYKLINELIECYVAVPVIKVGGFVACGDCKEILNSIKPDKFCANCGIKADYTNV